MHLIKSLVSGQIFMSFVWMAEIPCGATRGQNRQHDQSLCCEMSLVALVVHAADEMFRPSSLR